MSNATNPPASFNPAILLAKIDSLSHKLDAQQHTIEELRIVLADSDLHPRKVVYKSERATTLLQYLALQEQYPVVTQTNFFNTVLPAGHGHFDWSDFHYTDGMVYKPPPVMEHQVLVLPESARKHELDLVKAQGFIANATQMYDTFADDIIDLDDVVMELGQKTLAFLNTLHILASNDTSKLSVMCKDIYLWQMELTTTEPQDNAILTLEDLAKCGNDNNKPPTKKKPKFKKTTPQSSDGGQDKKSASGQKGDLP
ncbi:hypothetical protein BG005_002571, partial [Podila minutissima]